MADSRTTEQKLIEHKQRKEKRKAKEKASKEKKEKKEKTKKKRRRSVSKPTTPVVKEPKLFKEEELHCIVCFEFPGGNIYQCGNGHLMCEGCYEKIIDSVKPICPTCRAKLNRDRPSRNRFAETVLAALVVPCPNENCDQKLKFATVKTHSTNECGFRKVQCKFDPLGCDWSGIAKDKRTHEKDCPLRRTSVKALLKKVQQRNKQKEDEQKKTAEHAAGDRAVCHLLTKRARDIIFRDLVLEKDLHTQEMCSKTFSALGLIWECVLSPKPKPEDSKTESSSLSTGASIFLRVVCSLKRTLSFAVVLLPGPDLASVMTLKPTVHHSRLKKTKQKSKKSTTPFPIPIEKELADRFYDMDKINIRLGLVDFSNYRPASNFMSGQGGASAEDSDSESIYGSEMEDDGLSIELTDRFNGGVVPLVLSSSPNPTSNISDPFSDSSSNSNSNSDSSSSSSSSDSSTEPSSASFSLTSSFSLSGMSSEPSSSSSSTSSTIPIPLTFRQFRTHPSTRMRTLPPSLLRFIANLPG